jgi:hypothetical protein
MSEKKLRRGQLPVFYLLWIVSAALSILDWFALRSAATAVAVAIAASVPMEVQIERQWYLRWPAAAVDKFALACFGILAMLAIMSLEWVYRVDLIKGTINKRFAIVAGIQVGLLVLSQVTIWIARRAV